MSAKCGETRDKCADGTSISRERIIAILDGNENNCSVVPWQFSVEATSNKLRRVIVSKGRSPKITITDLSAIENTMLSGSMETIPSSYEDSAILLDHDQDFGFIRDEDDEDDYEHVPDGDNEGGLMRTHRIPHNGSINENDDATNEDPDDLASTGILILEPAVVVPPPVRIPSGQSSSRATATIVDTVLSPQLTMPGTDSLPTEIQSHIFSVRTPSVDSSSSFLREEEEEEEEQRRTTASSATAENKQATYVAYGILGSFLFMFCMLLVMVISLYAERRTWVHSNQQLENQMKRMQKDWVNLANKWQMDQEASLATSRNIKASLQAQVEEQRRKIDEMYQKQHEQWEKKEQEKERRLQEDEKQRRKQQERARRQQEELYHRREAAAGKKHNMFHKPSASFYSKKSFFQDASSDYSGKSFDEYWSETEDKLLQWSDEAQHRLRSMLNGLGKKVWKAKESFMINADKTFHHVRTKLVNAWNDFYAALHEPQDGWTKAAPVISTVLLATAAAALSEGTSRFVRSFQNLQEEE